MSDRDDQLMRAAMAQAHLAAQADDVPVGAAVLHLPSGRIIGLGRNRREADADPTGHAEVVALRAASRTLERWRLHDCVLAVTLEPCPMCAGAIVNARIARLIYGCDDPKAGSVRSLHQLCEDPRLNHRVDVVRGLHGEACAEMLRSFFRKQRALGKK